MTLLVYMGIILPLMPSAFAGGNNHFHLLLSCLFQHCITIIGTIRKELVRGQIRKQFSGGYRIVYVARREKYTAFCTSDFLSEVPPFAPVAC